MLSIGQSYSHCRHVARSRARNFYYSFLLLPRERRNAMCAIYAFMRRCDDLSDEPGAGRIPLEQWRHSLTDALEGRYDGHAVWPALHDTILRYGIPTQYLQDMIEGVMSDLEPRRLQSFDELYRYCYHVASVAGLAAIHIFGFHSPDAIPLAEKCGIAFQLTNILRDVREDLGRDRIYLPAQDLQQFRVTEEDLRAGRRDERILALLRFEAARARQYYLESAPLVGMIDARSRGSLRALISIYSRLLDRIEQSNYDVFSRRISLPAWEKVWIAGRAALA